MTPDEVKALQSACALELDDLRVKYSLTDLQMLQAVQWWQDVCIEYLMRSDVRRSEREDEMRAALDAAADRPPR